MAVKIGALSALLMMMTVLVACGDDDSGSAPATVTSTPTPLVDDATYLRQLETALIDVNEALPMLAELREEAFGPEGDAAAIAAYGAAYEQFVEDRDAAVHGLPAPETLGVQQAAIGTATGDALEFGRALNTALQENPPEGEADYLSLVEELDGVTIAQRFRDACTDLQRTATEMEVEVDLQCLRTE